MTRVVGVLGALALLSLFPRSASAEQFVWYDEARQALAIDTTAYGYGHTIEVDFNSDHSTAGIIMQGLWYEGWGAMTEFYVYEIVYFDESSYGQNFGFGGRVGGLAPEFDVSISATELHDGPADDGFSFSAPVWDLGAGETVIYARPIGPEGVLPVTEDMLANTFVRFDEGPWFALADVPEDLTPIDTVMKLAPGVIQATSDGGWFAAQIEIPAPYTRDDVDLDSFRLTAQAASTQPNGAAFEGVKVVGKVERTGNQPQKLIGKFDRAELLYALPEGETTVYAIGRLKNGRLIRGSAVLEIVGMYHY